MAAASVDVSSVVSLHVAEESDCAELAAFAALSFSATFGHLYRAEDLATHLSHYRPENFLADINHAQQRLWVARLVAAGSNRAIVGYVQAGPCSLPHADATASNGELKRLYVDEKRKGCGVAPALFELAQAYLKARFSGPIYIGVWSENYRAQKFYKKYGYEKCGEYLYEVGEARDREWILSNSHAREGSQVP
jgi:ribosomal protein S18 acetylase RimI-like enzyme